MSDSEYFSTEALLSEETATLDAGSQDSGTTMFYSLWNIAPGNATKDKWSQPIPSRMSLAEAEYYALIKSLRVAKDAGYSRVFVSTNSPPILDHIRCGETPSAELETLYRRVLELVEDFDRIRVAPYAVDHRP